MPYPEQAIARALYDRLASRLGESGVSVEGAGVHWRCSAARGSRWARTSCFSGGGGEYLTAFGEGEAEVAWGRTSSRPDTENAVARWLDGATYAELLAEHAFVEATKRRLEALVRAALDQAPRLEGSAWWRVRRAACDVHELAFAAGERAVAVSFYGNSAHPDAHLTWDGCLVARARVEPSRFGGLLAGWLIEKVMPSELAGAHPELELLPEARFYEEGRPIEGELLVSWDRIEAFYRDERFAAAPFALRYIASLRGLGFDKTLRAGQSLWTMMLSRSRRHGLRDDQPYVAFDFRIDRVSVGVRMSGSIRNLTSHAPEPTAEVVALLQELEACPLD